MILHISANYPYPILDIIVTSTATQVMQYLIQHREFGYPSYPGMREHTAGVINSAKN